MEIEIPRWGEPCFADADAETETDKEGEEKEEEGDVEEPKELQADDSVLVGRIFVPSAVTRR